MLICQLMLLFYFRNWHQVYSFLRKVSIFLRPLDQLVEQVSRVQRLCPHCSGAVCCFIHALMGINPSDYKDCPLS